MRSRASLIALALCLAMGNVRAQEPAPPPLPRGADVNDWEPYYDLGVEVMKRDPDLAQAAFYWAARRDPTRAEPPFGEWVAFWLGQGGRRFNAYVRNDPKTMRDPSVAHADSLRTLAMERNPFVHQGLFLLILDAMPGRFREDMETTGWIAYANANLPAAVRQWGMALERSPDRLRYLHLHRAAAFVSMRGYDSAAVELDQYLRKLQQRDAREAQTLYVPKTMLEYAQGLLLDFRMRPQLADEAFARALMEDISFAPAHRMLGLRALNRGRLTEAVRELSLALELNPGDVVTRLAMGDALLRQGKAPEAVDEYRRASEAEPYYAEAAYKLGDALERAGQREAAVAAYTRALQVAARSWTNRGRAESRLAALR